MTPYNKARKVTIDRLLSDTLPTIMDESKGMIDKLVKINDLGILTIDSQVGCIEKDHLPIDRSLYDYRSSSDGNSKREDYYDLSDELRDVPLFIHQHIEP